MCPHYRQTLISELSSTYKAVILAVDSRSKHRYELLPGYKSGRHSPIGDPYEDYPDNVLPIKSPKCLDSL